MIVMRRAGDRKESPLRTKETTGWRIQVSKNRDIRRQALGLAAVLRCAKEGILMNTNETRVAVISIIVEEPGQVPAINDILHDAADAIIGRMGLPYREKNISIISVVADADLNVINNISGRLGRLPGVTVKTAYSKK